MNLSSLLDGTVTLSACTSDRAGNRSATRVPRMSSSRTAVVAPLTAIYSGGALGLGPNISGSSECGATIIAVKTGGGNLAKTDRAGNVSSAILTGG